MDTCVLFLGPLVVVANTSPLCECSCTIQEAVLVCLLELANGFDYMANHCDRLLTLSDGFGIFHQQCQPAADSSYFSADSFGFTANCSGFSADSSSFSAENCNFIADCSYFSTYSSGFSVDNHEIFS